MHTQRNQLLKEARRRNVILRRKGLITSAPPNRYLLVAGCFSMLAAVLHLGCIVFGGPWLRFLGAGEQMAQMAEAGHWYPNAAALSIATVLSVWSLYAFSGAGTIRRLPLLRLALCAITGIYLLRGLAFAFLMPYFPGNSTTFWIVTSAVCLSFGVVHLVGLKQEWSRL